jgi:hypothetical protein
MEEWKKMSDIMALTKNYLNQAQTRELVEYVAIVDPPIVQRT